MKLIIPSTIMKILLNFSCVLTAPVKLCKIVDVVPNLFYVNMLQEKYRLNVTIFSINYCLCKIVDVVPNLFYVNTLQEKYRLNVTIFSINYCQEMLWVQRLQIHFASPYIRVDSRLPSKSRKQDLTPFPSATSVSTTRRRGLINF
jgi:hypothetical protein